MKPEKKHPCAVCKKPTDLKGWVWETPAGKRFTLSSGKKKYIWWCEDHFLVCMFNLTPFSCTAKCREDLSKKLGIQLRADDVYVWLGGGTVLVPAISERLVAKAERANKAIPLKHTSPKCPHCGKGMKVVKEAARLF